MKSILAIIVFLSTTYTCLSAKAESNFNREVQIQITCESHNYNYAECPVRGSIRDAWVIQQKSNSPCIQGDSWGMRNDAIWVNRGCRANFNVVVRTNEVRDIVCESHNYRYQACYAGGWVQQAYVVNKMSNAPCNYGNEWGINRDYIWVDRGCRATFRVEIDN